MPKNVLALLVEVVSDVGHEIATALGDPDGRQALMGQAGREAPAGAPPSPQQATSVLQTLHDEAHAGAQGADADTLKLLADLTEAMAVLVSYVELAANAQDGDDAWNLVATWLDAVALMRLREQDPSVVALFGALHLISENRLLIADLIRAHDQWGSFVLGHPADDDATADSLSIIFAAALLGLGALMPFEDDKGARWVPDMLFGWDPEPSPPQPHATHVLQRMATVSILHRDRPSPDHPDVVAEEHAGLTMVVVPPTDGGWGVFIALDIGGGITFPIGDHLELVFEADLPDAFEVFTGSDIVPGFSNISATGAKAKVSLRRKAEVADHWTIGDDKSFHLEIGTFLLGLEVGDPTRLRLAIGDGALVLPQSTFGFLKSILPSDGAKFTFDVDLQVDSRGRLTFAGGAGMTVTVPVNKSLSVLTVRSVTVVLAFEDTAKGAGASAGATVAFSVSFGKAFKVIVDQIGAKLVWALPSPAEENGAAPMHGNLGTYGDVGMEFVAPRGIGVLIDIPPVKGGGFLFFDPPHRTYGGVLEASLSLCKKGLQIKAAGLLRETDDGWSFVVIISAQFDPAIEIFLGLTLNGVGGMVGINVSLDVAKLQAGLHDGAVGRLLFPDDPVANAPAIIETMAAVFPPRPGGWVAGPMFQLGWGRPNSFVKLSVAVVLSFPSPALLAILGRFQLVAPDEHIGIVSIKADFLGVISFEEPAVSFDASLVDSKLAAFPLTGDMAMRANADGFILSVGGFNPQFTPPASVPKLRRLAVDISANPITKIRAEAYVAVTSNTFQVGLHASLDIDAGPASVHGWLDFDALVQWEPKFHFSIHMSIGLELRWEGQSIAGISVDLLLEGPGPWHAKGTATLHFLFFSVHAGFEVTWGEVEPGETVPELDAAAQVALSLAEDGAWSAIAPDGDALVTFRTVTRRDIGVHPYGQLSVRQQAVPIGIPVTRVGRSHVKGGTATVTLAPIAGAPESSPTIGKFAIAQFQDLSDDEKLSRPSFESFQDGIAFGTDAVVLSKEKTSTATYETVFIPELQRRTDPLRGLLMLHAIEVGAVARSGLHAAALNDGPDQRVRVTETTYRVASTDTMATSAAVQGTFASSTAAYAAAAAADGRVVVVEAHEVTV